MAIQNSSAPLLTIPGMMGPRTTTDRSSAIVAPQAQTAPALSMPGRPMNAMVVTPPPRQPNIDPAQVAGPASVPRQTAPMIDYGPPRPIDDPAQSQMALDRGQHAPQGNAYGYYQHSPEQQHTIDQMTYGNYVGQAQAPQAAGQGYGHPLPVGMPAANGNTGIVPPGFGGSGPVSGATMPGLPRPPTMPTNTAMTQRPTTSTGLPTQLSRPTGRPAGGMFPRLG